jgi:lipopolysaccharide transport system permease protein
MVGSNKKYMLLIEANPLTSVMETFKFGFLGQGTFSWFALGYSLLFSIIILLLGIVVFNKVERSFMDVI